MRHLRAVAVVLASALVAGAGVPCVVAAAGAGADAAIACCHSNSDCDAAEIAPACCASDAAPDSRDLPRQTSAVKTIKADALAPTSQPLATVTALLLPAPAGAAGAGPPGPASPPRNLPLLN